MRKIKNFILLLSLLFAFACREEFLLQTKNYYKNLVVDGFITNDIGPYTIKLYSSSPIDNIKTIPYSQCTVTLFENSSKSEVLLETEPGVYKTSEDGIQGIVGNDYYISIETPTGNTYISDPQTMKKPVGIDSVYAELVNIEDIYYVNGLPGYQFYIDTKLAQEKENYILWNMIETYQYSNDYHLESMFDGRWLYYMELGELPEYENLFRCWKTQNSGNIITSSTEELVIPKITHQPLHFVGTDSKRLQERYSLLLQQYSIDKNAYEYWKSLEEQINQTNFLVTNQPYNITGNVYNINNTDEIVYGYFTVGSISQKRIFVDRPRAPFYYVICAIMEQAPTLPPYFYVKDDDGNGGMVLESCIDCTSKGGEPVKPDFWIEK